MLNKSENRAEKRESVVIKKYANRRLYNTETSSYITLDLLSQMTREGREFVVVDAKTGEDITHNVLTQIIMEQENGEQTMLPVAAFAGAVLALAATLALARGSTAGGVGKVVLAGVAHRMTDPAGVLIERYVRQPHRRPRWLD